MRRDRATRRLRKQAGGLFGWGKKKPAPAAAPGPAPGRFGSAAKHSRVLGNVLRHNNVTRSLKTGEEEAKRKLQQAGHKLAIVKDDLDKALATLDRQKEYNTDELEYESKYNRYGNKRPSYKRKNIFAAGKQRLNANYARKIEMAHNKLGPAILEAEQQIHFIQQTLRAYASAIPRFEQKAKNYANRGPVKYMGNLAANAVEPTDALAELQGATETAETKLAAAKQAVQTPGNSKELAKTVYDLSEILGVIFRVIAAMF